MMKLKYFLPLLAFLLVFQSAWTQKGSNFRYIMAPSGLNFRESPDAGAQKIQLIAYGEKVELLAPADKSDLVIDGIPGGMAKISYNGKTGYAFEGYLGRFPAPKNATFGEEFMEPFAESIRSAGYNTLYETIRRDYGGYYQFETALVIDGDYIMDGYLMARELFHIPPKLHLPKPSSKLEESVENPEKKEYSWSDELVVKRNGNGKIVEIYYSNRGEGGGKSIVIKMDPDADKAIRVSEIGIAD